ncbi:MAG: hypothetical protein OYG31_01170 [Candidatus Kaiserbacteria bacterium]|nr:hypothetical protein [Candidatus Kaiserbacteria bacterium]
MIVLAILIGLLLQLSDPIGFVANAVLMAVVLAGIGIVTSPIRLSLWGYQTTKTWWKKKPDDKKKGGDGKQQKNKNRNRGNKK